MWIVPGLEGQLGWVFYLPFLSSFFIFPFMSSFFVFLVLAFTSFLVLSLFHVFLFFLLLAFSSRTSLCFISVFYFLAIFWCDVCVRLEIINLSRVILSTLHLCSSYPCFLWSLGWCRPDFSRTVLC